MPDGTGRAYLRNEPGQWLFTIILAVAGPPVLVLRHDLAEPLWAWPLSTAGLLLLGVTTIAVSVLEYDPSRLRNRWGPFAREVHLDCLTEVSSQTPIGVPQVLVKDAHGHEVRLTTRRHAPQLDQWGPLVLRSAARCGVPLDPHTGRRLDPTGVLTSGPGPGPGSTPR